MPKVIGKIILIAAALAIIIPVVFLAYLTVMNTRHKMIEDVYIEHNREIIAPASNDFSVTIFNIGYAGLDQGQDFFADGGKSSRAESFEKTMENLSQISAFIMENDADFLMIQELDIKSRRSYDVNQFAYLKEKLPNHSSSFAYNYNAIWVPVPLFNPMGYANSGLATFSKYNTASAQRYQLEGQESWPVILAELDRCFLQTTVPLDNGRSLVLINLHLSAYDKGGKLRSKQVEHVITHMEELFAAGHYVVIGGDWNQLLSSELENNPDFMAKWPEWLHRIPDSLTATGFKWGIDKSVMTVRDLDAPYVENDTFEAIIDGFLVSPNVEIISVTGHDHGFKYSDHNPVTLKFSLIPYQWQ